VEAHPLPLPRPYQTPAAAVAAEVARLALVVRRALRRLRPDERAGQRFDTLLFSPATQMDVMREAWMEQVKTDPRVFYSDLLAGVAFDGRPLLEKVALPTLVIHGADDKLVTLETAQSITAGIRGATLEVVADAGHIAQLEQPDRVNALLAAFGERTA